MTEIECKPKSGNQYSFMFILREIYRAFSFAVFAWAVPWFFVGAFKGTPIFWTAWLVQLFTLTPIIIALFSWNYYLRVPNSWIWEAEEGESERATGKPNGYFSRLGAISFVGTAFVLDFLYLGLIRGHGLAHLSMMPPYIWANYLEMFFIPLLVNSIQGRMLSWWEVKRGII